MNRSHILDKPSLFSGAALVTSVIAASFISCSSDSTQAPNATVSTETSEPGNPPPQGTQSPTDPSPDAGKETVAPADDCKKAEPTNVCGVSPQCGCEASETCDVIDSTGTAICVNAGTAPMGYACQSTQDCARGLTCIFDICHALCNDPTQACSQPGTGACAQIKTTDGVDIPNLQICRVSCALHDPMSCGGTTSAGTGACRVDDKNATECSSAGSHKEGESCSKTEDCGPALTCVTSGATSVCKPWCRVGKSDCPTGKKCAGFAKPVNVGGVVYGACG